MKQVTQNSNIFVFIDPISIDQKFNGIEDWLANDNGKYSRQKSTKRKKQEWADRSKNNSD